MCSDKQTTKLLVVFGASSKRDGSSLNDCLYAGPPLLPLLMDVIVRFRCFIALVGDREGVSYGGNGRIRPRCTSLIVAERSICSCTGNRSEEIYPAGVWSVI